MDIRKMFDQMCDMARAERAYYHVTLSEMIGIVGNIDGETEVILDCGGSPGEPGSYRGYYSDLAFDKGGAIKAKEFLEVLSDCLDKTFAGYKGGDFTMDGNTPLWIASYGNLGRAIVSTIETDGKLVLVTKDND